MFINDDRLTVFGRTLIDNKSLEQIRRCLGPDDRAVLTADAHYGYGHPIGGAVAYKNHISLSGVGFDIACGNKAVKTNVRVEDVPIPRIMDEIYDRISFGMGRKNNEPADHPVLDKIRQADFKAQRKMLDLAASQLGTVGAGNHFVDLFSDDQGWLWLGVHFGSRGFGHRTTTGFIALSRGQNFDDRVKEGSMDDPPILFELGSGMADDYLAAMHLAGEYAYAGRDVVIKKLLEILDNPEVKFEVHNHHNFAWKENHFGEDYWVVRKGCTPAFPGQMGFIGANMEDESVIIRGIDSTLSRRGLYSTVHGAGRVMSRRQAAGKKQWRRKSRNKEENDRSTNGLIDFEKVKSRVGKNVELRGGAADEAPECYKNLDEVLNEQGNTIEILCRLKPVGVAMAPTFTFDPYRD